MTGWSHAAHDKLVSLLLSGKLHFVFTLSQMSSSWSDINTDGWNVSPRRLDTTKRASIGTAADHTPWSYSDFHRCRNQHCGKHTGLPWHLGFVDKKCWKAETFWLASIVFSPLRLHSPVGPASSTSPLSRQPKLRLPEATSAKPTYTHMAIKTLVDLGYVCNSVFLLWILTVTINPWWYILAANMPKHD